MRDYRKQVRECIYEWLKDKWRHGGEDEIVRSHNRPDDYCDFERKIINDPNIVYNILNHELKDLDEALRDIIDNGYYIWHDIFIDPNLYFSYMTNGKYIALDLIIRKKFIPVVLYDAMSDIINYYNELEDMK